jgi:MtaA/CmuA family methyltransferase
MRDRVEAVRLFKARAGGRYSILGWIEGPAAEAADVRGVQNFLMDLMEEPEFACALMDRCVEAGIEFARAQFEAGADTIGIGDAIASQVSPGIYSGLIQPREKRLVKAIQAMGAWVKLHICGNITHLLPGIADLGVEVLDVDHMVDLRAVRAAVGPKVALTGNIDPAAGVLGGAPAAIRAKMKQCLAEAGAPYMANAGCEIPAGTPEANLLAVCEPLR